LSKGEDVAVPALWQKLALGLTFAMSSAVLESQDNPCLQRTVLVSALENSGRQVSGPETDAFAARIGRQKIQIASVRPAPADRRAVLLLDVSGSMAGDRVHEKWPTTIAVANQLLSSAPASLSLGMIAFSDKLLERVDFGPAARDEIASLLQKNPGMSPAGRTPLLDTIDRAIGVFTPSRVADAIYLISDAGDNYSKDTMDKVRTRLLVSGVRLHLIYIHENAIVSPYSSEDRPDTFSTLALESGGWVLDVPASLDRENARIRETIAAAVHAMVSDPLIEVQLELPHELTKWRYWDLRVLDEHGRKRKKLMLLYPHLLVPQVCVKGRRP
jgi:Mg-chelatase subunit ChlD